MTGSEQIDPDGAKVSDYTREIRHGHSALHLCLKDDKEWWLAHAKDREYEGALNGSWLLWTTYPTGPWELNPLPKWLAEHELDELYYVDYDGEEAHSIHSATVHDLEDAPEFVQAEVEGRELATDGGTDSTEIYREDFHLRATDDGPVLEVPGGEIEFSIFADFDHVDEVFEDYETHVEPVNDGAYWLLRSGRNNIADLEIEPKFVPEGADEAGDRDD